MNKIKDELILMNQFKNEFNKQSYCNLFQEKEILFEYKKRGIYLFLF